MAALSNYLENKILDAFLRAQAYSWPATAYIGLFTVAPTAAGGGTEVTGGSYARASVAASLANWAGTQGAGTTTASSGTSGQTSNNGTITFATPTASWGTVVAIGVFDAATGGNLLFFATLSTSQTISSGNAVTFAAAQLTFSLS